MEDFGDLWIAYHVYFLKLFVYGNEVLVSFIFCLKVCLMIRTCVAYDSNPFLLSNLRKQVWKDLFISKHSYIKWLQNRSLL